MPIYEYRCQACKLDFEVKRGFFESQGVDCPRCKCQAQRIFSPVPIVFKGPGFYVTDNASNSRSEYNSSKGNGDKPAEKASEASSDRGKAAEKSPDAKPADSKATEITA